MKNDKTEVRKDTAPAEVSHLKGGHKWLANITGITAVWAAITFILGLCGDVDLPANMRFLNVWYLVNMCIIALLCGYATLTILKRCPSLIFWGASSMYILMLQAISLVIYFFYQQDVAAINAIAMFVWAICWYGYMVISPAVESDLPSAHRNHSSAGNIIVAIMTVSTVAYGILMAIKLLW